MKKKIRQEIEFRKKKLEKRQRKPKQKKITIEKEEQLAPKTEFSRTHFLYH